MNILFLHQNFPGQFLHLAPALAQAGHRVSALTSRVQQPQAWRGVQILPYPWTDPDKPRHHPWLRLFNTSVQRGEVCLRAMSALAAQGYRPDAVIAHSGWGEALFVREVWPEVRLGVFSELFYRAEGADVDYDPEFATPGEFGRPARIRMRNLAMRMQLESADAGLTPTAYQADSHPPDLRAKLSVIHDGIDTTKIGRDGAASFPLPDGRRLGAGDEVITFVNRNLEPYRGFHVFMRALPDLLRLRPQARVVIVGSDGASYGAVPRDGRTWRQVMTDEISPRMPAGGWDRVHFTGRVPYDDYLALLGISTVHVYLTYPFVLSWSLLEAMAAECAIVASDTDPVREVVTEGETGLLADFFDAPALARTVAALAADPDRRRRLGQAARRHVAAEYDLRTICLPRQLDWVRRLTEPGSS